MNKESDKLTERLRAIFQTEAGEHLRTVANGLAALEKAEQPAPKLPPLEVSIKSRRISTDTVRIATSSGQNQAG